mmetsp:Transcript_5111/g.12860  ORF Transcript_5111/g.12860 Transcript_5111/m.12860 type:complete len:209 (+) Transcript_5111:85-711(+)
MADDPAQREEAPSADSQREPSSETQSHAPGAAGIGRPAVDSTGAPPPHVTADDIRAFRTSIAARRFPHLRKLRDEEVEALLISSLQAGGQMPILERRTHPKSQPTMRSKLTLDAPVWCPSNAAEAKATITITADPEKAFVGMFSPYDADRQEFLQKKHADTSKIVCSAPFIPSNNSEAKKSTEVDYFIYSATAAEKDALKAKLRSARY